MQCDSEQFKRLKESFAEAGATTRVVSGGSKLFSSEETGNQIVLLTHGQARIIDADSTFGNQTICRVDSPQIFGLSTLFNKPYLETIRASKECEILTLDEADLKEDSRSMLQKKFKSSLDQSEWPYLYTAIKQRFKNETPNIDRGVDFELESHVLKSIEELKSIEQEIDRNNYPLIYIDTDKSGFTYGQIISPEICDLSFKNTDWPRILIYKPNPERIKHQATLAQKDSKLKEKDAITQEKADSIQTVDVKKESSNQVVKSFLSSQELPTDGFNYIRVKTRRESFFSCLQMLNDYFNLPPRVDTLQRAADYLETRENTWSNDILNILDKFGLAVRLVKTDIKRPLNLPTPALWINKKGYCNLITSKTTRSITLIDPIKGRKVLNFNQALQLFNESPEIVSVDIGLHTPTKKFDVFWLLPYIRRYRTQLIEVFAASFLNQIFALATPLLFQQIIDRVISKGASDALTPLAILMLTCAILEVIFSSLRTFQFVEISNRIDIGVGSAIVSRLLRLNARFFDTRPVGELSSRMGELTNIRNFLTGTALTVVLDAIFSLLYFSVMIYYSITLTLIIFLTIPPLMLVTVGITPVTQKLIRRRAEAASRTQSLLVEILGGIQTVKLQNAELSSRKKWEDRHLETINQGFKAILANTGSSNALQLINKLSSIIVIGVGASLVLDNKLTLGELIAFRIIAGYVTQPMMRLASSWQNFQEMSLSLERVGDIVNQSLEVKENEETNIAIPEIKGSISLENVSYEYSTSSPPVLSSLSLDIPEGSFTGFVGQSGCGKSTLLKMIPRLYRPSAGRVFIDKYDISKVDLYSLRSQIGFVPQDCMLFEGTIFSNIALGDPNTSSEEIVRMAKLACAHEFIMGLPYGYSTPIGEKGSGLSGGQRQRIALARMLLEKPKLVILDEATSALDVDTERQVVENLRNFFTDTTMLMITHRLSSLTEADQIVVLHSGRIDSVGTHPDLMAQRGRYYALYKSQFGE